MDHIRAVVVDPNVQGRLTLKQVAAPSPLPSEALVRVLAISLNLGEVRRSLTADAGWRPGWDLPGVVEKASANGSGPQARCSGCRVSTSWSVGRAGRCSYSLLGCLPDSVSFAQAATLPVAGLTALYALDRANGSLLNRSVLVTGASGGVGVFGCQLARPGGAQVVGVVRRAEREKYARDAGAHEVVIGDDISPAAKFGPYHMVIESVGGSALRCRTKHARTR